MLDHVTDQTLLQNIFEQACITFGKLMKEGKVNDKQIQLTLYSLFKQANEGNADEFKKNKKKSDPINYAAWLQQVEKSHDQCIKEYVILVGQCD